MVANATQSRVTEIPLCGDIFLDIIKTYVSLDGNPDAPRGYCPLCHGDERSFVARPEQGEWHCFNCGQGGDVYGFIEKLRRVSHPEAMRFVEILSQSHTSRIHSFGDRAKLVKKSGFLQPPPLEAKPVVRRQALDSAANTPAQPMAKDTLMAKQGTIDIGSAADKSAVLKKVVATAEVLPQKANESTTATKAAMARGEKTAESAAPSPDPAAKQADTSTASVDKEKLVTELLRKLAGNPGLYGLAVVARDDEGEMLGSSVTQLLKKDIQVLDAYAKKVVEASRKIIGDYDTHCMDVLFSMDATYKAERTKLIWVPVGRAPCQCNVLLVLAEDARESVFVMKLKNFFK